MMHGCLVSEQYSHFTIQLPDLYVLTSGKKKDLKKEFSKVFSVLSSTSGDGGGIRIFNTIITLFFLQIKLVGPMSMK
jgi:hypothetical protein